ncbi:MAG: hypothetical protein EOP24_37500 [Hyphomicrobiales bacterium]|nr:MAG: hypothetical protein EOP24_37500 [Hyphomicrobiales bacterium]
MTVSLAEISKSGTPLQMLQALQTRIAVAIDDTQSARELAALARRFMQVIEAVALEAAKSPVNREPTPLDVLDARMQEKGRVVPISRIRM